MHKILEHEGNLPWDSRAYSFVHIHSLATFYYFPLVAILIVATNQFEADRENLPAEFLETYSR